MKGYFNRLLSVNLSDKTYTYEEIPDAVLSTSLGGKGLGAHLLMERNPQGVDPLDPANLFILAVGPVTGTTMWGQNRFAAFTKSPATGGYGESYCGGTLAPKIKGCGIDALILSGSADGLCALYIDGEGVRFEDATSLSGADTAKSQEQLLDVAPKGAGALVIGPAGENLVRLSCIKSDRWRSLGRGGLGAVLGSKNLKGLVFGGRRKAEVHDPGGLRDLVKKISQTYQESPVTELYRNFGTPSQVRVTNGQKCFPTHYWSSGYFEDWEKLSADYMQTNFQTSSQACPPCFLRCTNRCVVKKGRHEGLELEGPEYETIYAIGGLNGIDSLEEVAFLNDLCDRLGLDTMSAGNLSAFAVEACKRGKIDFSIDYNQPDRVAELYRLIAVREGIGDLFAEGIERTAAELDLEDIAVHVKGLEPAGFDPRVLKGMGLSYATAARGACHLRGTFYKPELSGEIEKDRLEGKAELLVDYEDRAALFDCLILCRFYRDFINWDELIELIAVTTGQRLDQKQLQARANSITQLTRRFNRREGLDSSTDSLPPYLFEPNKQGASIKKEELEILLNDYNGIRGPLEV